MAGHISKRGKNTWRVRISFGLDSGGKRRTFNATVHGSKKDAEKYLTEKLREKNLGTFVQTSLIVLDEYLDKWLEQAAKSKLSGATFRNYEYLLKIYVRPQLGERRMHEIQPFDIQALYSELLKRGLSPRTVRYVHAILSGAFKQAIRWRILAVSPCSGAELPKQVHSEMMALSRDEAKRFLEACRQDKLGLLFSFALISGMRPEEYLAVKWSDLDFDRHTVTVQRTLIREKAKGGGWYFDKPKTPKSRRSIPMPQDIFDQLKTHRTEQLQQMLKLGAEYERLDLVFANEFGRPLDLKNLRTRNFARILKAAGLCEKFRVYDLRHSMATLMLSNGENPKVVSERLGHASVTLTMDVYSHVLPDIQREATDRLGKVLFG